MSDSGSAEQVINALFSERLRFEGWIAALEAKRDATPAHIYHRVHADYAARLQRVMEQLGEHRAALEERESTLMDRLGALDIDEAKHRDEAAEAELRAVVGELTSEAHSEIVKRTRAVIEASTEERTRIGDELLRLRAILEVGARGAAKSASTAAPPPPVEERVEAPAAEGLRFIDEPPRAAPTASPSSLSRGMPRPPAPVPEPADEGDFDELAFLKSLDESTGEGRSEEANGRAPAANAPAPAAPAAQPARPPIESPPAPAMSAPVQPRAPVPPPVSEAPGRRESASSYIKDSPPEQVKTLKCQECGTLNYPTEWYCERCGAELAAL